MTRDGSRLVCPEGFLYLTQTVNVVTTLKFCV